MIAHHAIPAGAKHGIFETWAWDPWVIFPLGLLGILYGIGLKRSAEHSMRLFPWWRIASFYVGLGLALFALVSPIDHLSEHLFFVHMIQHMLLIMWSVPLILLGAPIIPILRGMPRIVRRRIVGPVARNISVRQALNVFRRGRVAFGIFFGGIWLWYMPIMYDLALISTFVHYVEHIFFMSSAFIFWTFVIDPIPFPSRKGYVSRMLYLFGGATPNAVLGAYLTYSPQPWYTFYQKQPQLWFITVLEDQSIGGLVMWLPSWMMLLVSMGVMFFLMMREEDQKQIDGYQ